MFDPRFRTHGGSILIWNPQPEGCPGATTCPSIAPIVRSADGLALNLRRMAEGAKGTLDADSCKSTEILLSFRKTSPRVAQKAQSFARGHDFVRLLGAPLAANRGRPAHHRFHATAHLCRIRDFR